MKLRQAHDLVDQASNLLIDVSVIGRKSDRLAVVASLQIGLEFFARLFAGIKRTQDFEELCDRLLRVLFDVLLQLLEGHEDARARVIARGKQSVGEVVTLEHRRGIDPAKTKVPSVHVRRVHSVLALVSSRGRQRIRALSSSRAGVVLAADHANGASDQLDGLLDQRESCSFAEEFIRGEDRANQLLYRMVPG